MEPWHKRLPQRWLQELEAVDAAALQLRLELLEQGLISWRGTVEVDGTPHFLQIVYPPDYPARAPRVRETSAFTDDVTDDRASYHQMLDGSLCLFAMGTGPDAWSPDLTVVDVVARYKDFRRVANERGHVDEHGAPLYRGPGLPGSGVLVMTPAQRALLRAPQGYGWLEAKLARHGNALVVTGVDAGLALDGGQALDHPEVGPGPNVRIPWLAIDCERWEETGIWTPHALDKTLRERFQPGEYSGLEPGGWAVLVREQDGEADLLVLAVAQARTPFLYYLVRHEARFPDMPAAVFERVDGAISGRESLADWTVVFVGLGSLGGSIAVHLARTGVSNFLLFDPELLEPENVARHVAGLQHVYRRKVDAVDQLIRERNPEANVSKHPWSPLWDGARAASLAFEEQLAQPRTLVVVSAAEQDVERAVNMLAVAHGCPAIYASVMGEAAFGRVHRVLPGETACYDCLVPQQRSHPGRFFRAPEPVEDRPPAMAGYRQPGVPGLGIDVESTAVMAARMALQTISRLSEADIGYSDASGHHLVWTSRSSDGFDAPLQVRVEPYKRDPACPTCSERPVATVLDAEATDRLAALQKKLSTPERLTGFDVPILEAKAGGSA